MSPQTSTPSTPQSRYHLSAFVNISSPANESVPSLPFEIDRWMSLRMPSTRFGRPADAANSGRAAPNAPKDAIAPRNCLLLIPFILLIPFLAIF